MSNRSLKAGAGDNKPREGKGIRHSAFSINRPLEEYLVFEKDVQGLGWTERPALTSHDHCLNYNSCQKEISNVLAVVG